MKRHLYPGLIIALLFFPAAFLLPMVGNFAHAQETFSYTVLAWDSVHGSVAVPITMNDVATGFNTPHTFTEPLDALPSFSVPMTNSYGTRLSKWSNGMIRQTVYVETEWRGTGNLTAIYDATPYDINIWAWDPLNGWLDKPITMDGVFTGFNTPHTFAGLKGMHSFTVPTSDSDGREFTSWNPGPDPADITQSPVSPTITICSGGTYTAQYSGPPYSVNIWAWNSIEGWLEQPISMDGFDTGFKTPHTFTDLTEPTTFTVPGNDTYGTQFTKWNTGETSTSLTVDSAGSYTAQYYVWRVETVDSFSSDVGRGTSIALDSAWNPHIAYIDYSSDSVKYAKWAGSVGPIGVWNIENVEPPGANVRYNTASLALDANDVPHISYSNGPLTYASKPSTSWSMETVDSADSEAGRWSSLKLDSIGNPHIAYVAATGALDVKYATRTGTTWTTEHVTTSGYTGYQSTSLALDSNNKPYATWFHSGAQFNSPTVYYSNKTAATWGSPVSVASGMTSNGGCSIAIDALGNPCIAYYDEYFDPYTSKGSLKFARWNGFIWQIETVDSPSLPNQDWVGQYPCLVMDHMGRPHISYYESWWTGSTTAGILKYAWWTGSSWSVQTADSTWNVGKWSSIAVSPRGKVHISYYDETNKCLKYVTRTIPNFDSKERFYTVSYQPLDIDGDGKNNAIKATMDVDSDYFGTQKVKVTATLRDPTNTNCAWNFTTWNVMGVAYDYTEVTLYVPAGRSEGMYDVRLVLSDNGGHVEETRLDNDVAYLYPPAPPQGTYSAAIWAWNIDGWLELPITKDGSPTEYTTPHTWTDLTGPHTFTVQPTANYPFANWNTGETSTTITVNSPGTYTARYAPALTVFLNPTTVTMPFGQSQLFLATASGGSDSYSNYQWYVNGIAQSQATASTYNFVPALVGQFSITVTVTDNLGMTSAQSLPASVDVNTADTTPPTTSTDYDGQWHSSDFTITLTATDSTAVSATYYKINNGPTRSVPVDGQPRITTEGSSNTLEYWSVDSSNNEELPHKMLTAIKLDKTEPTGSIQINNGAQYTNATGVTLTLSASDQGGSTVSEMCFSNDGATFSAWEQYKTSKSWTLEGGPGSKYVYVQFKDHAGLTVSTYQMITLDTMLPVANAGQNKNAQVGQLVSFDGSGSYDNLGIASYSWNFGDGNTGTGASPTHTYSSAGTYTVTLMVTDLAGNSAASVSTVTVEVVIPEFPSSAMLILFMTISAFALTANRKCKLPKND